MPLAFISTVPPCVVAQAGPSPNGGVTSAQPTIAVTAWLFPSAGSVSLSRTPSDAPGVVSRTCGVAIAGRSTTSCVLPIVSQASSAAIGGSFTGVTVIVDVTGALVARPSLASQVTVRARPDGFSELLK